MIEDEKRVLTRKLEEKSLEVNRISHMQFETMNQVMIANHEINSKDIEITTLKLHNEKLSIWKGKRSLLKASINPMNSSSILNNWWDLLDLTMIHMDWDTLVLKKENHPKVLKKEVTKVISWNLFVIIVVRKDILQCLQEKDCKSEC